MTTIQELHDRKTRGLVLTPTEEATLHAWYAQEDEAENRQINAAQTPQRIEILKAQIKTTLAQVAVMTQRIQNLMHQNEELRLEVSNLKDQVSQRLGVPA